MGHRGFITSYVQEGLTLAVHRALATLRVHCQGQGFYVGLALWPGGTAEDWQPAYDATTGVYGLNPCNVTGSYNGTGITHRAFLVPRLANTLHTDNTRRKSRSSPCASPALQWSCTPTPLFTCCKHGSLL